MSKLTEENFFPACPMIFNSTFTRDVHFFDVHILHGISKRTGFDGIEITPNYDGPLGSGAHYLEPEGYCHEPGQYATDDGDVIPGMEAEWYLLLVAPDFMEGFLRLDWKNLTKRGREVWVQRFQQYDAARDQNYQQLLELEQSMVPEQPPKKRV